MRDRFEKPPAKSRQPHRHEWLWEPLEADATFVLRSMFGAKAAYLDGKLMLCFCVGEEPWRGVLVCTDHFEPLATRLVALARRRDPRLGVTPKPRKPRGQRIRNPHASAD